MTACAGTADRPSAAWISFGNRSNSSALGRFMTPDWSASPAATPYANLSDPQSLNLYSYVLNNPATATDPTRQRPTRSRASEIAGQGPESPTRSPNVPVVRSPPSTSNFRVAHSPSAGHRSEGARAPAALARPTG